MSSTTPTMNFQNTVLLACSCLLIAGCGGTPEPRLRQQPPPPAVRQSIPPPTPVPIETPHVSGIDYLPKDFPVAMHPATQAVEMQAYAPNDYRFDLATDAPADECIRYYRSEFEARGWQVYEEHGNKLGNVTVLILPNEKAARMWATSDGTGCSVHFEWARTSTPEKGY